MQQEVDRAEDLCMPDILLQMCVEHKLHHLQADVKTSCPNAKPEAGEVQECLASHRPLLSWDCQEQLFRQEVENAEDLRLSVRLFRACLADKKKVSVAALSHTQLLHPSAQP